MNRLIRVKVWRAKSIGSRDENSESRRKGVNGQPALRGHHTTTVNRKYVKGVFATYFSSKLCELSSPCTVLKGGHIAHNLHFMGGRRGTLQSLVAPRRRKRSGKRSCRQVNLAIGWRHYLSSKEPLDFLLSHPRIDTIHCRMYSNQHLCDLPGGDQAVACLSIFPT